MTTAYYTHPTLGEIEVTAEVAVEGEIEEPSSYSDEDQSRGVISDPEFTDFYSEDSEGDPIDFTAEDFVVINDLMTDAYWAKKGIFS